MKDPVELAKDPRVRCYSVFTANNFDQARRRAWMIWAAGHQACPDCKAEKNEPCLNMVDLRKMPREEARKNRNPHDKRIDWERMLRGMRERGLRG